eukprot:scaffold1352_cov129-Isochrysis_galbana.AAC.2
MLRVGRPCRTGHSPRAGRGWRLNRRAAWDRRWPPESPRRSATGSPAPTHATQRPRPAYGRRPWRRPRPESAAAMRRPPPAGAPPAARRARGRSRSPARPHGPAGACPPTAPLPVSTGAAAAAAAPTAAPPRRTPP